MYNKIYVGTGGDNKNFKYHRSDKNKNYNPKNMEVFRL